MGGQSHRARLNHDMQQMGGQQYGESSAFGGMKAPAVRAMGIPPAGPARAGLARAGLVSGPGARGVGGRSGRGGPIR